MSVKTSRTKHVFAPKLDTASGRVEMTVESVRDDFLHHLRYTLAKDQYTATDRDHYYSLALAVRDRLIQRWIATQQMYHDKNVKRVCYMSMEFLIGRLLGNNVINLGMESICEKAMSELGLDWNRLRDYEVDAGLGNGGLGRLAACYLDSMSTLGYPAVGYGLRYEYGMFNQRIINGRQVEEADSWLRNGYPWETTRPEYTFEVRYGGHVEAQNSPSGTTWKWVGTKAVVGQPYDLPVVGYGGKHVNTLRLWSARAPEEFDLDDFNRGSYVEAVENKVLAENLTKVLYPNDNVQEGQELRLRQEYFFVSCTLQDIVRRFRADKNSWSDFPDKAFIQMNDTHPALVVPELMHLLTDVHGLSWDAAWDITTSATGYTNHTILPEALEKWPVSLMEKVIPRHLQIIYEINARLLHDVAVRYPLDMDRLKKMSLVEESGIKSIRMANLAITGSSSVNGVSEIHTHLLKTSVFPEHAEYYPEKFNNKTNGITPRRWLLKANPPLAKLISRHIGESWITNLDGLRMLEPFASDAGFRKDFREAKKQNKNLLAAYIREQVGCAVSPDALFDVQVKRLHEYKRQLMFLLYIIVRYNRFKEKAPSDAVPRVFIFGGKAAPGFAMAKLIIKLVHQVGSVVNHDPKVKDLMKVVFLPNYRVSLAEKIIPAANLSEQISLAGMEASGTGNMKFQLNGALTIGTMDGANIEICQEVGSENMFIFGMTAEEVRAERPKYDSRKTCSSDPEIRRAMELVERDFFSLLEPGIFRPIVDALLKYNDYYMIIRDMRSYIEAQDRVDQLYRDHDGWDQKAILNVARAGKFSSDRAVKEYARDIWHIQACDERNSHDGAAQS